MILYRPNAETGASSFLSFWQSARRYLNMLFTDRGLATSA